MEAKQARFNISIFTMPDSYVTDIDMNTVRIREEEERVARLLPEVELEDEEIE